jgi:hypothetical protein
MDDSKDAFTSDVVAVLVFDATIVQGRRFVESNSARVDVFCEGNLLWMEILPT